MDRAVPVPATNAINNEHWHNTVTPDLRNHLIAKLIQAIFPTSNPAAILDTRMNNIRMFATKTESDMFEKAHSRSEYYHLLAEKMYKIQKELEERRRRREEGCPRQSEHDQITAALNRGEEQMQPTNNNQPNVHNPEEDISDTLQDLNEIIGNLSLE